MTYFNMTYFKNTKLLINESKKLHREIMELEIENAKIDSLNPYNLNQNIAYEYSAGF